MNKKTAIQFSLFSIIVLIFILIFFKYFNQKIEVKKKTLQNEKVYKTSEKNPNIIKDIEYLSKDSAGNTYKINAKFGEIKDKESNLIILKNVKAIISIIDSEEIVIYSNFAKYNSQNYNTNFYENIRVHYAEHKINSEYLDFLFNKNLAILYQDIVYRNSQTKLLADRLEIDLITKNSKLSMKDENEKIEIFYLK
jgi:hypothetical protein